MDRIALQAASELIGAASNILLATHADPDGDAFGATLGLYWGLKGMGKRCLACCADPVPQAYEFLPGSKEIARHGQGDEDLVIALDAGELERLGSAYDRARYRGVPLVNIDHHITNDLFGQVNIVDTAATATAELVLALLEELGIPLDARLATCLLTGIVYDTQCFRTCNTTPSILRKAAALMEKGAPLEQIVRHTLNAASPVSLHLWGHILNSVQSADGIVWAWERREMYRQSGAREGDSKGLINLLAGVQEAEVAVLFREKDRNAVEISMRSMGGLDVSQVALAFGGGGHRRAAGCTLEGSPEFIQEQVLEEMRRRLRALETKER